MKSVAPLNVRCSASSKKDKVRPSAGTLRAEQGPADNLGRIYGLNRFQAAALISLSCALPVACAATPTVSSVNCQTWSITGALSDPCTITLSAAAPSAGLKVTLSSNNKAVTVPASVTVPANSTSMWFTATAAAVTTTQSAVVTASANGSSATTYLQLNGKAAATMTTSATSLAFGSAQVNSTLSQAVTLTSSGGAPLTISSAYVSGTGFKLGTVTLPATLNPGSSLTIPVKFAPTTAGSASGELSITSNSSTGSTTVISLSGTATAASVSVAISPTSVSLAGGGTQQFTSTVTGTSNTAVTWTLSGSGCSGSACGTISSTGLYTAPASVPSSLTVYPLATSTADTTKSAAATVTLTATTIATGKTYYLAPSSLGGSDSNNGLSASSPWLSPNHSLNCGDVILATPSTAYNSANFSQWGNVTCSAGNNVAWLACSTFDGCKITSGSGMVVDNSFWGVRGWEVTSTATYAPCFGAAPSYSKPTEIHHIIFANNVANGCNSGGIISYNDGTASVDYLTIIGNVVYSGAQGSVQCYSGISVYEPIQSDSAAGTHIYVAGNVSYGNLEPATCAGGTAPGADGIIFDTFDGSQAGFKTPYSAGAVAENNILLGSNGNGIAVQNNSAGSAHSPITLRYNTSWGNNAGSSTQTALCSEILINVGDSIDEYGNIAATNRATGCGSTTVTAFNVFDGSTSDTVAANVAYTANGTNTTTWGSGSFSFGSNVTGQNPNFPNAAEPGAPNCSGAANAVACMAQVVANFTPTNSAVVGYGYTKPNSTPKYDALFPQWLCSANIPSGLITMGCQN